MDDVDGFAGRASDLPEPDKALPVDPAASVPVAPRSAEPSAASAPTPSSALPPPAAPPPASSRPAVPVPDVPPPTARRPAAPPPAEPAGREVADTGQASARKKRSFLRELPLLLAVALVLALVVKSLLVQSFYIPTGSMEETLQPGARVLVNKVVYKTRDIKRGVVVVFKRDNSFNGAQSASGAGWFGVGAQGEKDYIKRVIGLPGDRVSCCDARGRLSVNGVPLDESAYLYPGDRPSIESFDIVVPEDRLWVMGDHRSVSQDSRAHLGDPGGGTVPIDKVVGLAFVIVWPLGHAGTLGIPETFSQPGLSGGGSDRG